MTTGIETYEVTQPNPLSVEDVSFFFLEEMMAVVLMGLSLVFGGGGGR